MNAKFLIPDTADYPVEYRGQIVDVTIANIRFPNNQTWLLDPQMEQPKLFSASTDLLFPGWDEVDIKLKRLTEVNGKPEEERL